MIDAFCCGLGARDGSSDLAMDYLRHVDKDEMKTIDHHVVVLGSKAQLAVQALISTNH